MLNGCRGQLRMGFAGPVGLDFGAVMSMAQARGADLDLVAALLPDIEGVILKALRDARDEDDEPEA